MLHEKAVISHIGCHDLDISLLSNVFKLSPELNRTFELPLQNDEREPDVVFVDADDSNSLQKWHQLVYSNNTIIAIMVTGADEKIESYVTIKKPIAFKSVLRALNAINITTFLDTPPGGDTATLKVLVVDDSLPVRKFMENKLTELAQTSLSVEFAVSGEEAGQKIKKAERAYDIIFLDILMPGADGYKVCQWIKTNYSSHVVLLTSETSPFNQAHGEMSGCNDYLIKPPDEDHLQSILRRCIDTLAKNSTSEDDKLNIA